MVVEWHPAVLTYVYQGNAQVIMFLFFFKKKKKKLFCSQNSVQWDRGMANKGRFCILYNYCLQHNAKPHWASKFIGKTHYNLKDHLNYSSVKLYYFFFFNPKLVWYIEQPRTESLLITAWHDNKEEVRFVYGWPEPSLIKRNAKVLLGGKLDSYYQEEGKWKTDSSFSLSLK